MKKIDMNMPNEAYHRGEWQKEYISSTSLKKMLTSPKYFKWCRDNGGEQISLKASMEGSVYHSMLASIVSTGSMDDFQKEYFIFDAPINPKTGSAYGIGTKAYMEAFESAQAEHPNQEATSQAEVELAQKMVEALLTQCGTVSDSVDYLIRTGSAEVSFFTEYEGAKFKFRTDLITDKKIVDWKTISADDLHEDTITRQIQKCNYGFSAAFYQFFHNVMFGSYPEFYWVFQQKEPPYDAVLVSAAPFAYSYDYDGSMILGASAIEFERVLNQYLQCLKDDRFDGAEIFIPEYGGRRIMVPALPSWITKNTTMFYNKI